MANSKGVSDVITTVLIILFVIAAVAIVGTIVIKNVGKVGKTIDLASECLNIDAKVTACNATGTVVSQVYYSDKVVSVSKLEVILTKSDGTVLTNSISNPSTTNSMANNFNTNAAGAKASVKATIKGSDGTEYICQESQNTIECGGSQALGGNESSEGSSNIINVTSGGCLILDQSGKTYALDRDVYRTTPSDGACISIIGDNIILEGNGYKIDGEDYSNNLSGLKITGYNVTLRNIKITQFLYGLELGGGSQATVSNVESTINRYGLYVHSNEQAYISDSSFCSSSIYDLLCSYPEISDDGNNAFNTNSGCDNKLQAESDC